MTQQTSLTITICMGSSCFSHGNQQILEQVQKFLAEHNHDIVVELKGSLCQGKCKDGPSMMVGEKFYTHLTVEKAIGVLQDVLISISGKGDA